MPTLAEFKDSFGVKLDAAMDRISGFSVPESAFCDLDKIHVFEDLPRAIFYWSLRHYPDAVYDVETVIDLDEGTATSTERIPHQARIQIRLMADDSGGLVGQWAADDMRDAVLAEFGHHPCVGQIPLLYQGFSSPAHQYREGIYSYVFSYEALLFLDGRIETNPLVDQVNFDLHVGAAIEPPAEEDEGPVPDPDQVAVREIAAQILQGVN